jgi:hypothetical protein
MAVGFPAKVTYANGDVFSASDINDTNGTLNLAGGAQWAAGKNRIINGNFAVNQRNFTSNTTNNSYNFDRFLQVNSGGTVTVTPQTFTAGTAPVAGYEAKNFVRIVTASQSAAGDYALYGQKIEDVRTLAGQTATVSFWAKAASGTPKIGVALDQYFGTAGTPSATVTTSAATQTITTSWVRYSFTISVPSISGKSIGTNNDSSLSLYIVTSTGATLVAAGYPNTGIQNITVDIWGVQVEQGSTATAFQTASGTIGGELDLCQRYYLRYSADGVYSVFAASAGTQSSSIGIGFFAFPVQMRITPSSIESSTLAYSTLTNLHYALTGVTIDASTSNNKIAFVYGSGTGLSTAYGYFGANNSTSAYIGFNAEL